MLYVLFDKPVAMFYSSFELIINTVMVEVANGAEKSFNITTANIWTNEGYFIAKPD